MGKFRLLIGGQPPSGGKAWRQRLRKDSFFDDNRFSLGERACQRKDPS